MIRMEPNMSPQDISQWLNQAWFLFKASPRHKTRVGKLIHLIESPNDHYVCKDTEGINFEIEHSYREAFFPHWPRLGSVNIPTHRIAVWLYRLQQQQWRRTYNSKQVRMTIPRKWELQKKIELNGLSPDKGTVVEPAFAAEYPGLAGMLDMFQQGWLSVAPVPQIIVVNTEPRLLYYRGKLTCRVDNGDVDWIDPRGMSRVEKVFPGGINAL